jgi:hypothetical protein
MYWYCSTFLQWKFSQAHYLIPAGGSTPYHYSIPLFNDPENNLQVLSEDSPFICSSAIQIVSGKKGSFWRTCIRAVQNNTIPEHGLVGKSSNNSKVEAETLDSLCTFFGEVESLCEVIPTRFVCDRSGTNTTRDNDNEVRTLPPYWSKRKLYARWCSERGWNVVTTQTGVMTHNKQLDWPVGDDYLQVVSWPYYCSIWKREFSHIIIRRPTADICDDCYVVFYNQVKYRKSKPESSFIPLNSTDEEDTDDDGTDDDVEDQL